MTGASKSLSCGNLFRKLEVGQGGSFVVLVPALTGALSGHPGDGGLHRATVVGQRQLGRRLHRPVQRWARPVFRRVAEGPRDIARGGPGQLPSRGSQS